MNSAYTTIPLPDKATRLPQTQRAAMRQVLPYATVASLLQCICVCGGLDEAPKGDNVLEIADPAAAGVDHQFALYRLLKDDANGRVDTVVIHDGDAHFVCVLLTLMLWCLLDEERSLSFYLVVKDFQRLQGWSYRYLWRHVASENDGLSMELVVATTMGIRDLCNGLAL